MVKILSSKWVQFLFSLVLIYFAFRKVDIVKLVGEISMVPWWIVVAILIYLSSLAVLSGIRWSWLVLEKTTYKDYWNFIRATYLGAFYSLFFPTTVAGDALKWVPLLKSYPELSKTRLAASVLIDRIVGLVAFVIVGFVALVTGKILGYEFPPILLWLFSSLQLGILVFWGVLFIFDYEKYFGGYKMLSRLIQVMDILKKADKNTLVKCVLVSLVMEPIWILPFYFYSWYFGAGIKLAEIFIFLPVIGLVLVLPISVAGFGARENLFLYFLIPLGYDPQKVLLVSTFAGIITVLNSLVGGVFSFIK